MNTVLKNTLYIFALMAFVVVALGALVTPLYAQDAEMESGTPVDSMIMGGGMVMDSGSQMLIDFGPAFAGQMIHVYVDIIAFLVTLFLVMKLGMGRMRYPIMFLALTLLFTALIPVIFGHQLMWLVALSKSLGIIVAMIWFMIIFGVFQKRS